MVSGPTDAAFDDVAHAQLLRDLFEIAFGAALVLHHRCAADHFQVLDLGKVREQLILHTIGEKRVLLIFAQVLQWQHGDTFVGWRARPLIAMSVEWKRERESGYQ